MHWGLLLKERICSLREQIFPVRVTPKFEVMQLTTLKYRIKMIFFFWICQRVWKTVKCQGKIGKSQRILKWMISGNPAGV